MYLEKKLHFSVNVNKESRNPHDVWGEREERISNSSNAESLQLKINYI